MFSIGELSTILDVNELDEVATDCVELISSVLLDRTIALELLPTADGTASLRDFDNSSLILIFLSGSVAGTSLCEDIEITRDGIVEDTENFSASLRINPEVSDVNIIQANAAISIRDSPLNSKSSVAISAFLRHTLH